MTEDAPKERTTSKWCDEAVDMTRRPAMLASWQAYMPTDADTRNQIRRCEDEKCTTHDMGD